MDIKRRSEEIINQFKSFRGQVYHRDETLPELLQLQEEMAEVVFGAGYTQENPVRIKDVEEEFEKRNILYGNCADAAISAFKTDAKQLSNAISAIISGNKGEHMAFSELENLTCRHRIIKNIELTSENARTEIDALVITPQGLFLVEVKNTRNNILIKEDGGYYVYGKFLRHDSNIAEKMAIKTQLVQEALNKAGIFDIKIDKLLLFTNDRIQIENNCKDIQTTFLGLLRGQIETCCATSQISEELADQIAEALEKARCKESYPIKVNVPRLKETFAMVQALLENAKETEKETAAVKHRERRNRIIANKRNTTKTQRKSFWETLPIEKIGTGVGLLAGALFAACMHKEWAKPTLAYPAKSLSMKMK